MLDVTDGLVHTETSLDAPWDARTPWHGQCLGPSAGGAGLSPTNPAVWEYRVLSDGQPVQGPECPLPSLLFELPGTSETFLWDEFPDGTVLLQCNAALDAVQRPTVAYSTAAGTYITYYNDLLAAWHTFSLGTGARTPVVALDGYAPVHGDIDVTVSYLVDTGTDIELRIRYQRERYGTAHLVQDGLRSTDMLRTAGTTHEGRFTWRFRRAVKLE